MNEQKQYCTFYLGNLFFGVDVLKVQEVILFQDMTHVPLSSPSVSGLINLRGETVTAIDLRQRLELPSVELPEPPKNVIISAEGGTVSLLVDEIGDVIEPSEELLEAPPENLSGIAKDLITGVYKLNNNLMLVLDTERTVEFDAAIS
ncbi:chemotaxis protein CheW [Puniceicoccaceae bacterium K14]|nr:chemotaxis protein CheW [Puniceicoccaceae bacterium K14]